MINFKIILNVLGYLLIALSLVMLIPVIIDLGMGNDTWKSFITSAIITFGFGVTFLISTRNEENNKILMQDAFLITSLSWLSISIFGALPFYFSESGLNITNSVFESMSGITTTGSSVIQNVESLTGGILIWRGLLQWMGGIGIIVMAVSILPVLRVGGMQVFRAESSDTTDKLLPRTTQIASAVILIYLILTLICLAAYWLGGMSFFDALIHAMTTIATGGFSTQNNSFASFNSKALEYVAIIFMVLSSLPILIYLEAFKDGFKRIISDTQILTFLGIIFFSSLLVILYFCLL